MKSNGTIDLGIEALELCLFFLPIHYWLRVSIYWWIKSCTRSHFAFSCNLNCLEILKPLWSLGRIMSAFNRLSMSWMSCWQTFGLGGMGYSAPLEFHLFQSLILSCNELLALCFPLDWNHMKAARSSWKGLFFNVVVGILDNHMNQLEVHNELTRCS